MKPTFETMPWADLRAYVLAHREDIEALTVFMSRCKPAPNSQGYSFPYTEEGMKQMGEVFRQKLNGEA
ncbi:DUF6887 family protein [Phormidesmis priestleyi]